MPSLLVRIASAAAWTTALLAQANPVDYAAFGHALLKELGEQEPPPLQAMLDRHYARLLLIEFDVRVPGSLLAKVQDTTKVATIAGALLDLEDRLVDYTIFDQDAQKARHGDINSLRKYVAAWRNKPLATEPPSIPLAKEPCLLVLAPTRQNFVGVVGWLGLLEQKYQDYWWNNGTAQFSDLRVQDEGHVQVIALEYAAPDQKGDVTLGFDMNTRERTGLLQHFVQRAAVSWCWRQFGDDADETFIVGFATDLVTDVLGQNNARSGGSGKSSATEGKNAFIPGAPSRGGSMEMVNADSSWRLSQGSDYFARVLRQAQKAGEHDAKESKDRLGHFLLKDAKGETKHRVTAPFLGKVAFDRDAVPDPYVDDYLEFHRAYRSAFVHWLQNNAGKGKAGSLERFRTVLQRLMEKTEGMTFEVLCQEIYGVPLAEKAATDDSLERRFLAWLATNSR
ncbi:MAG: hypothetical protein ABIP94_18015 [Planctomycetota bacterium]